jgi:hypothetical protein
MVRGAAKTQYAHTCTECGATFTANVAPDGEKTFCQSCFAKHLAACEREVLEDYVIFGCRATLGCGRGARAGLRQYV